MRSKAAWTWGQTSTVKVTGNGDDADLSGGGSAQMTPSDDDDHSDPPVYEVKYQRREAAVAEANTQGLFGRWSNGSIASEPFLNGVGPYSHYHTTQRNVLSKSHPIVVADDFMNVTFVLFMPERTAPRLVNNPAIPRCPVSFS